MSGVASSEPGERRVRRGDPQVQPIARGVGPWRDAQLPHPVAQAMSIRGHGRPGQDPIDDIVVRFRRRQPGAGHDGEIQESRAPCAVAGRATTRVAPSIADLDELDAPVGHVGEGRRGDTECPPCVRRSGRPTRAAVRAAGSRPGRSRPPARARSRRRAWSSRRTRTAAPPSHRPARSARSGRRVATAATSAASSPRALRSSAAGGSVAPARIASVAPSSSIRVIVSGSVVWALAATVRQPLRWAAATSGASERSVAATMARVRAEPERASRRTRSPGPSGPRTSSMSSRSGSARRSRSTSDATAASGPAALGSAHDPISRHARASLPMRATETVAAPRSTVAKARGSVVTGAC